MKNWFLVSVLLVMCSISLFAQDCQNANQNAKLVRSWVDLPPGMPEGLSFVEKAVYRSGDRIAVGIVQGFTEAELVDPKRLDRILSVLRLSFSQPQLITNEDDRSPRVTSLLLRFLRNELKGTRMEQRIADTEQYVFSQARTAPQK